MSADEKLVERLRYKAADAAKRFIDWRFGNDNEPPRISIPARPEEDDDLVLVTTLKDAASALEASEAKIAALTAERDALREAVEAVDQHERSNFIGDPLDKARRASWRGVMRKVRAALRQEGKP